MKKLVLPAILTFTSALVNAQDPVPSKITLDFNTKQFDKDITQIDALKKGQWYQVVISNINLNLYKVSLSSSDTTLSSPQKTPTFGSIGSGLDDLSKLISGITSFSTIVPLMQNWIQPFQQPDRRNCLLKKSEAGTMRSRSKWIKRRRNWKVSESN